MPLLSFGILDDLQWKFGPFSEEVPDLEKETLLPAVVELVARIKEEDLLPYFKKDFPDFLEDIVDSLQKRKEWHYNRYNKYYVLAFSIDGTKFDIYSKDCDKEEIDWELPQFKDAPNVSPVYGDEYNEPTVEKVMKLFSY